ncbi:MAG TPA: 50S ribosomal protein L35 [Solirubrobacteraceae bacterium]|nr:50S ribosomal protein L35 [Solirubrobacteraceae bacterium]
MPLQQEACEGEEAPFAILSRPMPKMKTHSGAKKRFKVTARGKVRGRHAFTSHILEKKSPKRKRRLSQPTYLHKEDERRVKEMLGVKR